MAIASLEIAAYTFYQLQSEMIQAIHSAAASNS
jgi:hypothetical protein